MPGTRDISIKCIQNTNSRTSPQRGFKNMIKAMGLILRAEKEKCNQK